MTDKEIEKALEVCPKITSADDHCGECPYFQKHKNCIGNIEKDALDYLNRLKAEIKRLSHSDQSKEDCTIDQHAEIHRLRDEVKQIRKDTAKEILQELFDDAKEMAKDKNYDFAIAYIRMKTILRFKAKEYGVEVD